MRVRNEMREVGGGVRGEVMNASRVVEADGTSRLQKSDREQHGFVSRPGPTEDPRRGRERKRNSLLDERNDDRSQRLGNLVPSRALSQKHSNILQSLKRKHNILPHLLEFLLALKETKEGREDVRRSTGREVYARGCRSEDRQQEGVDRRRGEGGFSSECEKDDKVGRLFRKKNTRGSADRVSDMRGESW